MAKKLPQIVADRLFTNMYVCIKCNAKMRASYAAKSKGNVRCRKCNSNKLRLKAKERRGLKV